MSSQSASKWRNLAFMLSKVFILLALIAGFASGSTKSVYRVWQPLSLHGTDITSVMGKESGVDYTVLMSRPVVLSGALPEDLINAVALSHKLASIGGYDEPEANLIVLAKLKLAAVYGDQGLLVTVDVTNAEVPKELEVSLSDVVKLSVAALKKTIQDYGAAYLREGMPCAILVASDKKGPQIEQLSKLSQRFVAKQGE
ncbi:hypothetical protein [Rubritalea tangerina]|uniref:Uncharacterized protein n=1 Tax=Rubritalea tangerina TaxID=430798 RepID=A0ABW4Z9H5_9BACT